MRASLQPKFDHLQQHEPVDDDAKFGQINIVAAPQGALGEVLVVLHVHGVVHVVRMNINECTRRHSVRFVFVILYGVMLLEKHEGAVFLSRYCMGGITHY